MTNVTREEFMEGLRREKKRREHAQRSATKADERVYLEYQQELHARIMHREKTRGNYRRRRR